MQNKITVTAAYQEITFVKVIDAILPLVGALMMIGKGKEQKIISKKSATAINRGTKLEQDEIISKKSLNSVALLSQSVINGSYYGSGKLYNKPCRWRCNES